jgi:hypothetical protein
VAQRNVGDRFELFGGCTAVVHNIVANTLPTFEETKAKWQKIPDGRGRLVIVYPRLPMEGLGMGGDAAIFVTIDDNFRTTLGDETFGFIDLPVGQHKATFAPRGLLARSASAQFPIARGATTYLKVVSEQVGENQFRILDESTADGLLRAARHIYKEAVPLDQQDRMIPTF